VKPKTTVALAVLIPALLALVLPVAACGGGATLPTPTVIGTIAFTKDGEIHIVNTDGSGHPPPVATPGWEEDPSWCPDACRIVYAYYSPGELSVADASVWVMNADGSEPAQLSEGNGFSPAWSPDGKQIVYAVATSAEPYHVDILIMNADGSGTRKLTDVEGFPVAPSWTPSGEVLFLRDGDLYSIDPDGSGLVRLTTGKSIGAYALSPDGKTLAYHDLTEDAIVAVSLDGSGAPVTLLEPATQFITDDPLAALAWTPDGKALAVASGSLDGFHGSPLYIVNSDGSGLSQVPGIGPAWDPAWRPE
jgi:TolB protein